MIGESTSARPGRTGLSSQLLSRLKQDRYKWKASTDYRETSKLARLI